MKGDEAGLVKLMVKVLGGDARFKMVPKTLPSGASSIEVKVLSIVRRSSEYVKYVAFMNNSGGVLVANRYPRTKMCCFSI